MELVPCNRATGGPHLIKRVPIDSSRREDRGLLANSRSLTNLIELFQENEIGGMTACSPFAGRVSTYAGRGGFGRRV